MKLFALSLAAALASAPATAHDTWLAQGPADVFGVTLELGTGTQFPVQESPIDATYLVEHGCRASRLATTLKPIALASAALRLRATPGANTCWVQTTPFNITLPADKIELYLREVRASPEQRGAWAAMKQRGLPWRERYTKHARIELGAPSALPAPLGMDLVIEHDGTLLPGQNFGVRVLRDGQPLAGQAVELRSENSALGIWRRSDAMGRLSMPAPGPGPWLLRAIDLRLSDTQPDTWDSRFVTLAFAIGSEAIQNGSSLKLNSRSANQTAATSAISIEPPRSTALR